MDGEAVPIAQGNLAGPSNVQAERSSDDEVPEFPTQRLDEEPAQPLNRRRQVPRDASLASEGTAGNSSSSESDWRADWRDFAGDDSSLQCSQSQCSEFESGSIGLQHEIGFYEGDGDLDDMDFRARYHDRFWQSSESTLLGDRESFRGPHPGPKARVLRTRPAATHFFDLFFDGSVVDQIVQQTNLYASQRGTGRSQTTNGGPLWVPTCPLEIRAFVGVSILMGMKFLPTIRDYWKRTEFLHCSLIPRVFTQNRFESLLRCLHLVNNEIVVTERESPRYDKLAKVRWVIDDFVTKSCTLYNLEKFITCVEIMVAYRGHYSGSRQYMPAKPTKYGFKYFAAMCNPSRYIFNLIPYVESQGYRTVGKGRGLCVT